MGPTKLVLDPILLYFEVAFVARIILSWYPKVRKAEGAAHSKSERMPPTSDACMCVRMCVYVGYSTSFHANKKYFRRGRFQVG